MQPPRQRNSGAAQKPNVRFRDEDDDDGIELHAVARPNAWSIVAVVFIFVLLITTLVLSAVTLSYVQEMSKGHALMHVLTLQRGQVRGQAFAFPSRLKPGAPCKLSAHVLPEDSDDDNDNSSHTSCLLCPCYPPNEIWLVDPEGDHSDVDMLCPLSCSETTSASVEANASTGSV